MTSFKTWFNENLADYAGDIANHGADAGYPHITYNSDGVALFDRFGREIWDSLYQDAQDFGAEGILEFVASFRRKDMADDLDTFKTLCVWYMCEKIAREIEDAKEEAA